MPLMSCLPKIRNPTQATETAYSISEDLTKIVKIANSEAERRARHGGSRRVAEATDDMVTSAFVRVADRHGLSGARGLRSLRSHAIETEPIVDGTHGLLDMQARGQAGLFSGGLFEVVREPSYQNTYRHLTNPENHETTSGEFLNGDIDAAYVHFEKK